MEVAYIEWGRFGQYRRTIAVLRDGALVDPAAFLKSRTVSQTVRVNGQEYRIAVEDASSRKNAGVIVHVPDELVLATVIDERTSSGWNGYKVRGPGEVRVEEAREGRYLIRRYFYVYNSIKTMIAEERKYVPILNVRVGSIIEVSGDTYNVRDRLKNRGYRWDPDRKVWYKTASPSDVEELKKICEQERYELNIVA